MKACKAFYTVLLVTTRLVYISTAVAVYVLLDKVSLAHRPTRSSGMSSEGNQVEPVSQLHPESNGQNQRITNAVDGDTATTEADLPGNSEPGEMPGVDRDGSSGGSSDVNSTMQTHPIHQASTLRTASSQAGPEPACSAQQDAAGTTKHIHSESSEHKASSGNNIDLVPSPRADIEGSLTRQGSACTGAEDSVAPTAAPPEHTTDVQQTHAPFLADAQDVMATREESLAAEPSLAHHASAVPTGDPEHGPYASTTFQIHQLGKVNTIVLDLPGDSTSAACILGILARRLNVHPGAIEMEFAGHQFSGDMVLPNSKTHTESMPITVHVSQHGMPDAVDLSAPSTPMQLQVVVRSLALHSVRQA